MHDVITTWTIIHRRPLEDGEDPWAPGSLDDCHLLWAYDHGEVTVAIEIIEM